MATRIMYLIDHYENPQAGTEKQLLQLIHSLDRSRYEPALTVLRGSQYLERNPFPCPVEVLGITRLAALKSILTMLQYALRLRWEGYRLVHCFFNDVSLIAPPLLRLCGLRVLVSRRDMGFWYTPRNLATLRKVAPFVTRYVANSQAVKRIVQQQERVSAGKIAVIYNGYAPRTETGDSTTTAPVLADLPTDVAVVGSVANLKPIKRIETLITAFALLGERYPSVRLAIVGADTHLESGDSMLARLKDLSDHLEVGGRVIFTGRVTDPMLYIKRFDVAVLCSESEGFSNALIEYMQAGRAIICTDSGGNPELIQNGRNGFLFPVGDSRALAARLEWLLSNRALAHRLGEAARESVRSTYTHTRMVTEQMTCYDETLAGGRSGWKFYLWPGRA